MGKSVTCSQAALEAAAAGWAEAPMTLTAERAATATVVDVTRSLRETPASLLPLLLLMLLLLLLLSSVAALILVVLWER